MAKFSGQQKPKIVPDPREPNGRYQREPKEETEATILSIAMAQPHRRGRTLSHQDGRPGTPVGRLILDGLVSHRRYGPDALEEARKRFEEDVNRLRWLEDSKRPFAVTSGGRGVELTPEKKAEIEKKWGDIRRALRDAGEIPSDAVWKALVDAPPHFDERTFAKWIVLSLPAGLAALAEFYGLEEA